MSKNIRTQLGKVIGKTLNSYHARVKPIIDDIKFKESYQGRIIDCMVGEIDDNYIETPATDNPIVKLEHSREGIVKVPSIKGKTILVDSDDNETDTPAEGCKLVSVGEEEDNKLIILSKNKNLSLQELVEKNLSTDNNSSYGEFFSWDVKTKLSTLNHIKIINGTYVLKICNPIAGFGIEKILFYDKNLKAKKHIVAHGSTSVTINNSENYSYIRITFNKSENTTVSDCINCNILLTQSSNLDYIEPKQHKTEILLDEPLRSLPNGVCDEIVGNKLIRRVGKMVLNGSEYWERMYYPPSENGTHIQFSARNYFTNKNVKKGFWGNKNLFICDRFPRANSDLHWGGKGSIGVGGDDASFMFTLSKSHELYTLIKNVSNLKEWLSENPITVIYQLAEPIVIEMPNSLTLQGFDDTTMYIENTITPTVQYGYNALIPYKEELRTQKEEVETNTLDIENNIIPYLMDMEFNLMLMEDN